MRAKIAKYIADYVFTYNFIFPQEAIEDVEDSEILDLEQHGKLHLLSGGTKVVQHSPPPKTLSGLKGTR